MSLAILDAETIIEFVRDSESFHQCANERFQLLDTDGDGILTPADLCRGLDVSLGMGWETRTDDEVNGLYDTFFARFDEDNDRMIGPREFELLLREVMLALARGIGGTPVLMALQPESLFFNAVEHELEPRKKKQMASESAIRKCPNSRVKHRKGRSHGGGLFVCFFCGSRPPPTKDDS